ncbi:uncharacterized protein LOC125674748 [Ostrea edulis]|uniref:uncharacterized protein LOC125674748 n=1 Tax=Ostrea edulis TaxID=37623 RepID=UPI002094E5F0|nr:uncharacterized protein LOC125674748 [Ostrea edulis]XP_048767974.1 uncharacterized protein LOC125674748 [Ostrea edulis]
MASFMTDSTDQQSTMQSTPNSRVRCSRTLPLCRHSTSDDSKRLATFGALCSRADIEGISPIRLAGSGCVYNAEEEYMECIFCGKIIMVENKTAMQTLYDLKHYHHSSCDGMEMYILKQERAIRQGIVNLDILKRLRHQRSLSYGAPMYGELLQEYGVTPRSRDFEVVDICYDP